MKPLIPKSMALWLYNRTISSLFFKNFIRKELLWFIKHLHLHFLRTFIMELFILKKSNRTNGYTVKTVLFDAILRKESQCTVNSHPLDQVKDLTIGLNVNKCTLGFLCLYSVLSSGSGISNSIWLTWVLFNLWAQLKCHLLCKAFSILSPPILFSNFSSRHYVWHVSVSITSWSAHWEKESYLSCFNECELGLWYALGTWIN